MQQLLEEEVQRYSDIGPGKEDSFMPDQVLPPRGVFVIAYLDGRAVGCGALRAMTVEWAEVKRMYVISSARRLGIGRAILVELERLALEFAYHVIRLETGNRQPEAISLYERHGYRRIPPFGEHIGDPVSLCFEKRL